MGKAPPPAFLDAACVSLSVRDYECDLSGIVNNANYLNYLEHARHEYLRAKGISFAELSAGGIDLVVAKMELEYRRPLLPGDVFEVHTEATRLSPVRFVFHQRIVRADELILTARVTGTAVNEKGRPKVFPELSVLD